MRSILVLSALAVLSGLAFSSIAPEYQCPNHPEDDCILCGGTPCFNDVTAAAAAGCTGVLWQGGSEGCKCFCPWKAPADLCAGVSCPDKCQGNQHYPAYCDPADGQCKFGPPGYCQNGCDAATRDCARTVPSTSYVKGDQLCEYGKGESCSNSPDCVCVSGWECKPQADDANAAGCAPSSAYKANDGTCDFARGESCATPNDNDCRCGTNETCNPAGEGSDNYGCVSPTHVEACQQECYPPQCRHPAIDNLALARNVSLPNAYVVSSIGCINGQCVYDQEECQDGCANGRCTVVPNAATGCQEDGTYIMRSGGQTEKPALVKRSADAAGGEPAISPVSSGSRHCKGDAVATDQYSQVWIKYKDGTIVYVGPGSLYGDGEFTKHKVGFARGKIQVKSPGAPLPEEEGVATLVPLQIAKDIQAQGGMWNDNYYPNLNDKRLAGLYWFWASMNQRTPMDDILDSMVVKQKSDVVYDIGEDGVTVTVLEGQATVQDLVTGQELNVSAGHRYVHEAGQAPAAGTVATVDVSTVKDDIADMPGEESTCCGSAAVLLAVLGGGAFLRRQPPGRKSG